MKPQTLVRLKAAALLVAVASLAACASFSAKPKTLACQPTAQWFTNDAQGHPNGAVFVCFGADGHLLWQSRALTLDEMQKLTAAPAATANTTTQQQKDLALDRAQLAKMRAVTDKVRRSAKTAAPKSNPSTPAAAEVPEKK